VYLRFTFTEPVEAVIETLEQAAAFDEIDPSAARSTARQALREQ
jgi:cell division control protein 6